MTPSILLPGEIRAKIVGASRLSIIPLTFDRVRLIISYRSENAKTGYDDGW